MTKQTPGPSVTTRARTDNTHWMTLLLYLVLTTAVFGYSVWSIIRPNRTPYSYLNGLVLTATAGLSVFAYLALYKDAIHLFHSEVEWVPKWSQYFAFGFVVPLICYGFLLVTNLFSRGVPLIIVSSLMFSTAGMAAVYLCRRHRYVGTP